VLSIIIERATKIFLAVDSASAVPIREYEVITGLKVALDGS
jgi:hypothetical protein